MEIGRQAIARSMSDRMVQSPTSVTKSPVALDTLHDNADRIGTVDKAGCSTATMEPNRPTDVGQLVAQLVAERMAHCVTNRDPKSRSTIPYQHRPDPALLLSIVGDVFPLTFNPQVVSSNLTGPTFGGARRCVLNTLGRASRSRTVCRPPY